MVDAEPLRPPPKFQVNIKIQLNTARVSRLSFRFLGHVHMRPEVNSNRFEISNPFEKSFRLHDDFAAATFQTVVRFYCTCTNDLGAIISDNQNRESATTCMVELYEGKRNI